MNTFCHTIRVNKRPISDKEKILTKEIVKCAGRCVNDVRKDLNQGYF